MEEKFRPIYFLDYDKISDTLVYLSTNLVMRFNVQLSYKDRYGNKRFFHREVIKGYGDNSSISVKRDLNFYYSIDDASNYKNSIMLSVYDVFMLGRLFDMVIMPWYFDKNVYGNSPDDNKLVLLDHPEPAKYLLNNYKYIQIEPIVYTYKNDSQNYGARITINDPTNFADVDFDRLATMYYLLTKTDMYALATNLLTYAKTEPYGTNTFNMGTASNNGGNFFDNM